ncbi:MAG: sulfate permease [Alteromonadaceae bacterium]|nr:sulfate permease [Alteromonadaceae bacterium]
MTKLEKFFPAAAWLKGYSREDMQTDAVASLIATILLIPQSMGYALLAGLPAVTGLYAGIIPAILYSFFGTSRTLAVGPVAVTSMMTATIAMPFALPGSENYAAIAMMLAFLSGVFLILMSLFKMGFLSNLLSHPVISGFISASAILIAVGQFKHLIGVQAHGNNLIELAQSMMLHINDINFPTVILSAISITFLILFKRYLTPILSKLGLKKNTANMLGKSGPVIVVIASTSCVGLFSLDSFGIKIVGDISTNLPTIPFEKFTINMMLDLIPGAVLISIVGFVGSVSVAQSFAAKRKQNINPNQELIGLGLANLSAAFSASFPVTGGFSRSVVNVSSGAKSPMTGILTGLLMLVTLLFFTPLFYYLPTAVLASSIIISILQLIDYKDFLRLYRFSKQEAFGLSATFFVVLFVGMETGIIVGVSLSLLFFLWHTSHPHIAVVGRLPGTEHFRNVKRFAVETDPEIITIRIDENLFFANARVLEDYVLALVSEHTDIKHLILMCNAVNMIDASALDSLETIDDRLKSANVMLHFSEIKGPVMDKLTDSSLIENLSGKVFLTQHQAINALTTKKADI